MQELPDGDRNSLAWTGAERFAFRTVFAYFASFGVASLLDSGVAPRRLLAAVHDPIVGWFGHTVMRLRGTPNDSGAPWAIAQQMVAIGFAVAVAALWSAVGRRAEYHRLHGWMRLVLRYYVAIVMLVYGGFKVIPSQFPPVSLEQLSEPVGALAPMGLLWTFMGYSTVYQVFTGFGETLGAVLLFFRKTTTAGALVLVAVLSNVALLNYAFDVPVKQLSTNLLLASIVLVVPDVRRLIAVLVLNRTAPPADLSFQLPRWLARSRRVLKPIIVLLATCVPLVFSSRIAPQLRARPPLFGIYDVDRFVRNGDTIPPLMTDSTRWQRVVFSRPGVMSTKVMTDRMRSFGVSVDTTNHRVTFWPSTTPSQKSSLEYEPTANSGLRVRGLVRGDTLDMLLTRLDQGAAYRLLRR